MTGIRKQLRQRMECSRRNYLLRNITKEQTGLEIGPSLRPVAPKSEGYQVEIIDHLSREALIAEYQAMGLDTSRVEEVDYLWEGGSYSETTGKSGYYDYVIASHVIEHVPDFAGFLQDCSNMLKTDGILSLAVPDKRFTLDYFRMATTVRNVIDDHLSTDKNGSVGALADYCSHVVCRGHRRETSWSPLRSLFMGPGYRFIHDETFARNTYEGAVKERVFHDIHQNVFTPSSFRLLIYELWQYGLTDLKIAGIRKPAFAAEFLVSLRKSETPPVLSDRERMSLIRKVSRENIVK